MYNKKKLLYSLLIAFLHTASLCDEEEREPETTENNYLSHSILLDEITCRIISDEGIIPVYLSDIWLPSALGVQTSLEERIIRMVWIARGADRGVKLQSDGSSQEYAEEYLDMLQKTRGVTRDELQKMCMSSGFTMRDVKKELNQQFLLQQSVETLLVASGCINVSAEEVKEFYDQNPTYYPAQYAFCESVCDGSCDDDEKYKNLFWSEKKLLNEDELPEHLQPLINILVGDYMHYNNQDDNSDYAVHLIGKTTEKLIPLSERYEEIMRDLQQKKYITQYKNFTVKFLSDKEKVFFYDESFRDKCIEFVKNQEQN